MSGLSFADTVSLPCLVFRLSGSEMILLHLSARTTSTTNSTMLCSIHFPLRAFCIVHEGVRPFQNHKSKEEERKPKKKVGSKEAKVAMKQAVGQIVRKVVSKKLCGFGRRCVCV